MHSCHKQITLCTNPRFLHLHATKITVSSTEKKSIFFQTTRSVTQNANSLCLKCAENIFLVRARILITGSSAKIAEALLTIFHLGSNHPLAKIELGDYQGKYWENVKNIVVAVWDTMLMNKMAASWMPKNKRHVGQLNPSWKAKMWLSNLVMFDIFKYVLIL